MPELIKVVFVFVFVFFFLLPGDFAHDHEQSEKALPNQGPSSSTLESPHVQVMERPLGSSGYRIPSHVFASSKAGTPHTEWSITSNDSLFLSLIHI